MRRGVSILEVMIAILVVSIGLLAALTVFPVAAHLAKKGEIADVSAVHGRAAVHEFDARRMRDPSFWMAWNPATSAHQPYAPVFSESYCIDPRAIAAPANSSAAAQVAIGAFPYSASATQPKMRRLTLDRQDANIVIPPAPAPPPSPPSPGGGGFTFIPQPYPGGINPGPVPSGFPMSAALANSIFVFEDDLTFSRPADRSFPAIGHFANGRRTSGGHFSWMATLTPIGDTEYVLSIVVFHDRPADMTAGDPLHERVVHCDFNDAGGLGWAGGEVFLSWDAPQTTANNDAARDVLKVRSGQWIMLAGFAPTAAGGESTYCRWYRVTEADNEPEYHSAEGHYAIAASLAGPDWDVTPGYRTLYGESGTPGTPPIAVLMSGAVAVYERTIALSAN